MQGLLPYDVRDYTIMGSYAIQVPILVGSTKTQRPFKTVQEAISFAKSRPGEVSLATAGVGYTMWVAAMAFQEATGLRLNIIPQAGAGALIIAQVAGGHTDLGVLFLLAAKSQIEAGNARLLAVIGSKRIPGYDQVPTLKEIGYNMSIESPNFVIGPPKMPKEVADKLSKAFQTAASDPDFQKFAVERNAIPVHEPPDQLVKSIEEERRIYRRIMEKAGILKEK
jgi:tripartite-type tricarboxylate transporter receptor subunit TctC